MYLSVFTADSTIFSSLGIVITCYASVNSSSAHPPPPPGNRGAFPNVARPEGRAFAYLGLTPGHLTHGFETVE